MGLYQTLDREILHDLYVVQGLTRDLLHELRVEQAMSNVARLHGARENRLPDLLRSWFGDEAGQPGTEHRVELSQGPDGEWVLRPRGTDGSVAVVSSGSSA